MNKLLIFAAAVFCNYLVAISPVTDASPILSDGHTVAWFDLTNPAFVEQDKHNRDSIYYDITAEREVYENIQDCGDTERHAVYKIVATETNYFYNGCKVGEKFICETIKTCDANNKVQKLIGHHLTQSNINKRPVDGIFDGVDDFMQTARFTLDQPYMLYMVVRQFSHKHPANLCCGVVAKNRNRIFQASTSSELLMDGSVMGIGNRLNETQVIRALWNSTGSRIQINNNLPGYGNAGTKNPDGFKLCGHLQVKEIIIRNSADSRATSDEIYNYLKDKHGVKEYSIASYANADYEIELLKHNGEPIQVLFLRNDYVFATTAKHGQLLWSTDAGATYVGHDFKDADKIVMAHIFENGNVLFATYKNELWLGKNSLAEITPKKLKDSDGSDYEFHTTLNPDAPGIYFIRACIDQPVYIGKQEMLVWGSYTHYRSMYMFRGTNPNLIYYSPDSGETIKVCYKFGPADPNNPIQVHHVHNVVYDEFDNCFYAFCGEMDKTWWLKGVYEAKGDSWTWATAVDGSANKFYRTGGVRFDKDEYLIMSDWISGRDYEGVWSSSRDGIDNYKNFSRKAETTTGRVLFPVMVHGDLIVCGHLNHNNGATWSFDGGKTWKTLQKIELLPSNQRIGLFTYPDSQGSIYTTPFDFRAEEWYLQPSFKLRFKVDD